MHGYETHLRGSPIERNGAARHERRARIDIVIGRVVKRTRRPKAVAVHAVRTRHLRIGQIRGDAGTVQIVHESVGRLLQRKHLDVFAAHQIHDLTRIGAPAAAMEVMAAKVEKEMRNTVNRRVNCDAANVDKAVAASREQVEALTRLTDAGIVATLPVKLQEVAVARLLQPELSLSELAETFDPPLTKSCLNHRMRKLMELAGKEKA